MGLTTADRVKENWTGSGTGAIALGGAAPGGFRTFGSRLANGDTCYYTVEEPANDRHESGLATYNSGPNTLTRSAGNVFDGSSGPGVLVNFGTGAKVVFLTPAAYTYPPAGHGAVLPATPFTGMRFLWVTTGRTWMMVYSGSSWIAEQTIGATALFVDGTNGTDSIEKGTGTGASAYRTVQFAINQLAPTLGGNVTITVAAGTYREQVTVQGKKFAGDFTLTLTTALSVMAGFPATATSGANPVGSGSAGYGTIAKTAAGWTVNAYRDKLVEITGGAGAGQVRVVHANTADTITVVGRWGTVPDGTSTFRALDWGTRITGSDAGADTTPVRTNVILLRDQIGVVVENFRLDYATSIGIESTLGSSAVVRYCDVGSCGGGGIVANARGAFTDISTCAIRECGYGISAQGFSVIDLAGRCRITGATATYGVYCLQGKISLLYESYVNMTAVFSVQLFCQFGIVAIDGYNEFEGAAGTSNNIQVEANGAIGLDSIFGGFETQVTKNSGGWGVLANAGGIFIGASLITYIGNTSGTRTPTTMTVGGTD